MAIAVEGFVKTKALIGCNGLAGSDQQTERHHLNIKKLQLLFVIMPTNHLIYLNKCFNTNKLKIHPFGKAAFKKEEKSLNYIYKDWRAFNKAINLKIYHYVE